MARFATGVTVITSCGDNGPAGMTANAFASLSLDPLLVMIGFELQSRTLVAVRQSSTFAVNVLASDQEQISRIFAGKQPEPEKFADCAYAERAGRAGDRRGPGLAAVRPGGDLPRAAITSSWSATWWRWAAMAVSRCCSMAAGTTGWVRTGPTGSLARGPSGSRGEAGRRDHGLARVGRGRAHHRRSPGRPGQLPRSARLRRPGGACRCRSTGPRSGPLSWPPGSTACC